MTTHTLIATCKIGLEIIVKQELRDLGFEDISVSPGRVDFEATADQIPMVNIWLRTADRIRLRIGEFQATTFDELFEKTKALPWHKWITPDGEFPVSGKSVKSQLMSVRSSQAIVKKAIASSLEEAHDTDDLPETGPLFPIQISLLRDVALLTIDTIGHGLHRRGYRGDAGDAPLKETLASGLVKLSYWNRDRLLIDPMCGAGTILIEAAQIAKNIAPGLNATFVSEEWPAIGQFAWYDAHKKAAEAVRKWDNPQLIGYDIDPYHIRIAQENAKNAGVEECIQFKVQDVRDLWIDQQYGILISNPPYGMRLSEFQEMNQIYIAIHKTFRKKVGWSVYIYTADKKFPDYFKRARPDRIRKLYNGPIEANYYQYHGNQPPEKDE